MRLITSPATSNKQQTRFGLFSFIAVIAATTNATTALASLALVNVKLVKSNHLGSTDIFREGKLLNRLELMSHIYGPIIVTNDGVNTTVRGTLAVSARGGSIQPSQNESYELILSSIPVGCSINVNAVELPNDATHMFQFDQTGVLGANSPTPVNVGNAQLMACEATKLIQVELHYPSGRKITFSKEELEDLQDNHKPVAYLRNGLATAGGDLSVYVDVQDAIQAVVTYSSAGSVETLKVQTV